MLLAAALAAVLLVGGFSLQSEVDRSASSTDGRSFGERSLTEAIVPPPPPNHDIARFRAADREALSLVPSNASIARKLQAGCYRNAWLYGNSAASSWTCSSGWRLPTSSEWSLVSPCVTASDTSTFSYYHDVAVAPGPNGCNCKWNANWCGRKSIDTIRQGRACGDYNQLMICVVSCTGAAPTTPTNGYKTVVTAVQNQYGCLAGYSAGGGTAVATYNCNGASWTGGPMPTCTVCPAGFYCAGYSQASPVKCNAGYFGGTTGLTSATCSGLCTAGYYCPSGSTSSTANQCGGSGLLYCPAGSSAPFSCPTSGYYTTPLTSPVFLRSGCVTCPANRQCTNGILLPGVDYSSTCSVSPTATVVEMMSNQDFGPNLVPTTPGCAGCGLSYNFTVVPASPAKCSASAVAASLIFNTGSGKLRTTGTGITYSGCSAGFDVILQATRTDGSGQSNTCAVRVAVIQVAVAPVITSCSSLPVPERSPIATLVPSNLTALSGNTGVTLVWSIDTASAPPGVTYPFTLSGCDGVLRVSSFFTYAQQSSFSIPLVVQAIGILPVLNATCVLTVPVQRVTLPPLITTSELIVPEGALPGTPLGNVGAYTQNDGTSVAQVWFSANDTRNIFVIDSLGNVTVGPSSSVPSLLTQPYYRYEVSARSTDNKVGVYPIRIDLAPVPLPPQTRAQSRSVSETSSGGTLLLPPLEAWHPQYVAFNFTSLLPAGSPFDITLDGIVYLKQGATLDYVSQATYTMNFYLTDANGLQTGGSLIIQVTQVAKPPTWLTHNMTMEMPEYAPAGTVGYNTVPDQINPGQYVQQTVYMSAQNADPRMGLAYSVVAANPPSYLPYFVADSSSGTVVLAANAPGPLVYDRSLSYPKPQTITLTVAATATAAAPASSYEWMDVTITNIRPRIEPMAAIDIPGAYSAGMALGTVVAWSPYGSPAFAFSITANDKDSKGNNAFAINAGTGVVSLSTSPAPSFNFNARRSFQITVRVTSKGQTGSANVTLNLAHANRPPVWTDPMPTIFAAARTAGNIGLPLMSYVSDPDLALGVGEYLSFALTPDHAGNTDNTFAIQNVTGQLYVANLTAASFAYPVGATSPPTYNLSITVTDAGVHGPRYAVDVNITIELTANLIPPNIEYVNLTVPELVPIGTVVGSVRGYSLNGYALTYSLAGAEANAFAPFPFTIVTVPDGGSNYGQIVTTGAADIDYNAMPRYRAALTVTDNNPRTPLSNSTIIDICVTWVPRPPYFDRATRTPNATVYSLSIKERSAGGTNVTDTPLTAWHKDPWQRPQLLYRLSPPSPYFSVDPVTAVLTATPSFASLDYNAVKQVNLTLQATDGQGLSDFAALRIGLIEVNKPAIFTGLLDANNRSVPALSVREDAGVYTLVGYVTATDPNVYSLWRARNFGIDTSTGDGALGFFAINQWTGAVMVVSSSLDFWDQPSFDLVVTVRDNDPFEPITVNQTVRINLIQTNRVVVSTFYVDGAAPLSQAVNSSGTVKAVFTTRGTVQQWLYIVGAGFGPSQRRLTALSLAPSSTPVSARIGTYASPSCTIVAANTLIACAIPEGAGASLAVAVTVNGTWTASSAGGATVSYFPPVITTVYRVGANTSDATAHTMNTRGGDQLVITADQIGPAGTPVYLSYGRQSVAGFESTVGPCSWVTTQQSVICTSAPGIGANLKFSLQVAAQSSASPFLASPVRYRPPTITNVTAPTLFTNGTGQQQSVVVDGDQFGSLAVSPTDIVVTYSKDFSNPFYTVFTAQAARITVSHTRIVCDPIAGVGTGLQVRVSIAGQTSASSTQTLSYVKPSISAIGGTIRRAQTVGGEPIVLSGAGFGPLSQLFPNGSVIPNDLQPYAVYGVNGTRQFTALDCRVTSPDASITCLTNEGYGKGLLWAVVVGGQYSPVFYGTSTDYHPPIVASYIGGVNGSAVTNVNKLFTPGLQPIIISGSNFGPLGTPIDSVTYGSDGNGSDFKASGCRIIVAHSEIECVTTEGAGAGLKFIVQIGGLNSVTPTASYGPPVIYGFGGPGAVDASTDGGDWVVINGDYFSTDKYLDFVTYGPSGTEYTATNCRLSIPHTQLNCSLVPGTGRALRWYVSVGKQLSSLSTSITSYAAPIIGSISPANATTDAKYQGSDVQLTITGTDFALRYPAAQLVVKINNNNLPAPSQPLIDAHWASLNAGGVGNPTVASWIAQLTTLYPTSTSIVSKSQHAITVRLPPGYGAQQHIFVVAGGVPSQISTFTYLPPVILNIAPDRQNVTAGYLRVFVEGSSFCASASCGAIYVNNVSYPVLSWCHTQILFVAPDPSNDVLPSYVEVEVNGQRSNARPFKRPLANINALVSQGVWTGMQSKGGEQFYVRGVLDIVGANDSLAITIGGRRCTDQWSYVDNNKPPSDPDASYTVVCRTPAGVGQNHPILLVFQNSTSKADDAFQFSYSRPGLDAMRLVYPFFDVTLATAAISNASFALGLIAGTPLSTAQVPQFGLPTLGAIVLVNGSNMGTADLGVGLLDDPAGLTPNVIWQDHDYVLAVVQPGDGASHGLRYTVGQQISNSLPFTFAAPTVTSVFPGTGPTLGGTVLNITGYNFGVSMPTVYIGGANCSIVGWGFANHSLIQCLLPPGTGKNLPVTVIVNGQSSLPANLFSYQPPVITSISPATGPTSGRLPGPLQIDGVHRDPGARVICTVRGSNFGSGVGEHRVSFLPYANSDPLARNFTAPLSDIISWNDSTIVFYQPEGFGYSLLVTVFAEQESQSTIEFSYDPPSVSAVTRFDRPATACRSIDQCFTFGNTTRCRTIPAGCYPTRGGYQLEIIGQSFGIASLVRNFLQVSIAGKPCIIPTDPVTVASLSHERVVCNAPIGLGQDLPVVVALGLRSSAVTNTSVMSYDPPMINVITPNTPDATGIQALSIRGANFGFEVTQLNIAINDEPCSTQEWLNDAQLRCQPPPQVVGAKNLSIAVANRTQPTTFYDVEEALVYLCAPSNYGMEGEVCLQCPTGAKCPGQERFYDAVTALAGYWRMNVSSADDINAQLFCDAPRKASRTFCPIFMPCGPAEACLAGNICAEGYDGPRCSYCLAGKYYRVNDQCVKCPNNIYVLYVGIACILILLIGFAWFLNKKNINLAIIAIGVDYAQVVSMFARTKIRWPALLKQLFQVLSAFNLNVEIVAPECLNPEIQFWQKWFVVESMPIAIALVMCALWGVGYLYKMTLNLNKKQRRAHYMALVAAYIVLYRIAFLTLTKTSFDVLNCTPTDPPVFRDVVNKKGSIEYMSGMVQPEYECWAAHSWQVFLFPFGVGTLVTYTFAIPGMMLWYMRRHKDDIKADQILRAKGMGDSPLENSRFEFRQTWQKLYYHYLPGKWYWEFCVTARKIFIAGITLAFRQIPSYQLAIALLVLFTAYVLHVVNFPYMSHTTKDKVVPEHEAKALYDPLHARVEQEIRDVLRRNFKNRRQVNVFAARAATANKEAFPNAVLLTLFDANTVEAILLGCCVLVSLAGIMLDSKRFDGDNWYIPQVQREFTGLTYGCLLLIAASLIYYVICFTIEMCLVFCPAAVPAILGVCCKKRVAEARRNKAMKNKVLASTTANSETSDTQVNPLMMRTGSANNLSGGADQEMEAGILTVEAVFNADAPNAALWKATQQSYGKLMKMVLDLRGEVRLAKQATEAAADLAMMSAETTTARPRATATRTRTNYSPMLRTGNDEFSTTTPLARSLISAGSSRNLGMPSPKQSSGVGALGPADAAPASSPTLAGASGPASSSAPSRGIAPGSPGLSSDSQRNLLAGMRKPMVARRIGRGTSRFAVDTPTVDKDALKLDDDE